MRRALSASWTLNGNLFARRTIITTRCSIRYPLKNSLLVCGRSWRGSMRLWRPTARCERSLGIPKSIVREALSDLVIAYREQLATSFLRGAVAVSARDRGGSGSFSAVAPGLDWVPTESEPGGEAVGVRVVIMRLGDGVEYMR